MARTWPSRRPSRMPCTSWSSHCICPVACRSQLQCIWCPRRAHIALPGQARWLCRRQLLGLRCLDAQVRRSCAWAADCCSWVAHRDRLVWPRCAGVMVVAAHNCRRRRKYQIEQGGVDGRGSSSSTLTHRAWDWVCRRFDPPRRARAHDMADVAVWAWCEAAAAQSVPYLCPSRRVSPGSSWRRGRWLAAGKLMSAAKENGWKLKDQWMLPGHLCMCVCVYLCRCVRPHFDWTFAFRSKSLPIRSLIARSTARLASPFATAFQLDYAVQSAIKCALFRCTRPLALELDSC